MLKIQASTETKQSDAHEFTNLCTKPAKFSINAPFHAIARQERQKAVVIDHPWAHIGIGNFDIRYGKMS